MSWNARVEIEYNLLSHICSKDVSVTTGQPRHANNLQSKLRQNHSHP